MKGQMKKGGANSSIYILAFKTVMLTAPLVLSACTDGFLGSVFKSSTSTSTQAATEKSDFVAGSGASVPGVGACNVPTGDALIARITNGLQGHVDVTKGNFKLATDQYKENAQQTMNPVLASGYDQAALIVNAACSDLTIGTGAPPAMKSVYGVDPALALEDPSATATALVKTCTGILDQYTAGLSSTGSKAPEVLSICNDLVKNLVQQRATTTVAFMSVCNAANLTGSMLLCL